MTETLLRLPDVIAATGLSKTTIYELQRSREFPAARRLSRRCVGWPASEVQAWIDSRQLALH